MKTSGSKKIGSNAFIAAPGTYRKAGEVSGKNSVKFAGRDSATLESHDPKLNTSYSMNSLFSELFRKLGGVLLGGV